jgi:hypothetical protein
MGGVSSKGGGGGRGGEMTQALYAHMNNKTIKIKKKKRTAEPYSADPHQNEDNYL